jgi:hypothetical protein
MEDSIKFIRYIPYFHDGVLISIKHVGKVIQIGMASAEIDPEEIKNDIQLARDNSLKGKLHLEGVKAVRINNSTYQQKLRMLHDHGTILDFEVNNGLVELGITWTDFHPKPATNNYTMIEIIAEKIWWENIPDLKDPFC